MGLLEHLQGEESAKLLQALSSPRFRHVVNVYPRFTQTVTTPLFNCFVVAVGRVRGLKEESFEMAVMSQVLVAQIMSFFRGASVVCRHMRCEKLNKEQQGKGN